MVRISILKSSWGLFECGVEKTRMHLIKILNAPEAHSKHYFLAMGACFFLGVRLCVCGVCGVCGGHLSWATDLSRKVALRFKFCAERAHGGHFVVRPRVTRDLGVGLLFATFVKIQNTQKQKTQNQKTQKQKTQNTPKQKTQT